jgi:hypothetical protein
MANAPAFAATPRSAPAALTTANTDRTGATATNVVDVFTGGASGSRIDEVRITQVDAAPAVLCVVLFVFNGSTRFYLTEQKFSSTTAPSTTNPPETYTLSFSNLFLPSATWKLQAITTITKNVHIVAAGGDF